MNLNSIYQISQTFTIRKLVKHQSKWLIPVSEMLNIFSNNAVKLTWVQKRSQLSIIVFVLEYMPSDSSDAKLRIQVHLFETHT